jgi:hypothetical protein
MAVPVEINGVTYGQEFRGLPYAEVAPGSPKESFGPDQGQLTRTLRCPWGLRHKFRREVLGYSWLDDAPPGVGLHGVIRRRIPMRHPDEPLLWADAASIEGVVPAGRDDQGMGAFDEAKLEIRFSRQKYAVLPDEDVIDAVFGVPAEWLLLRYVEVIETPAAKYQTIPGMGALRWVDGTVQGVAPNQTFGTPMSTTAVVPLYEADVKIVWWQVPLTVFTGEASRALVRFTNAADFGALYSRLGTKLAGTLVMGAPGKEVYHHNGEDYWKITYSFRWFPEGANKFFRGAPAIAGGAAPAAFQPGMQLATYTGLEGGEKIFPSADYTNLFMVGA